MSENTNNNDSSTNSTNQQTDDLSSVERKWGRVKWFSKQYGFVRDVDSDDDYFVHFTALNVPENIYGTLFTNEYVEFSVKKDENGKLFATDVTGLRRGPLLCEYEPNIQRMRMRNRHFQGPVPVQTN